MLLDRRKYSESGYVGEELFTDLQKDSLHKCMIIEQTIADGDFSLDEALEAYHITKEEYENYVARKSNANIFISLSGNTNNYSSIRMEYQMLNYIEVFVKMIDNSFDEKMHATFVHRLDRIKNEFQEISKGIEELKEKD